MFASIHLVDPLYGVPTSGEGVAERGRVCVCGAKLKPALVVVTIVNVDGGMMCTSWPFWVKRDTRFF